MPEQRDRHLKPLVPRLAGTRGTLADEIRRAEFLFHWVRGGHEEAAPAVIQIMTYTGDCDGPQAEGDIRSASLNEGMRACDAADIAIYMGRSGQGWEHAVEGLRQAVLIGPHWGLPPHIKPEARSEALKLEVSA